MEESPISKVRVRRGLLEMMGGGSALNAAEGAPTTQALAVVDEGAVCHIADLPSGHGSGCCT